MTLPDLPSDVTSIAFSRLWRRDLDVDLAAAGKHLIEVPHVRGVPVAIQLPEAAARILEWPNMLGILEPILPESFVRWDPALAPEPPSEHVIRMSGAATAEDLDVRSRILASVCRKLEQMRGVQCAIRPRSPLVVLLTPGLTEGALAGVQDRFPGSTSLVRRELGEFPGGLGIIATNELCDQPRQYAEAVEDALARKGAR